MTESEKIRYIAYLSLKGELDHIQKQGANLYLDGSKTNADFIARACVFNESSSYMRDYVTDRSGRLNKLSFDQVENG